MNINKKKGGFRGVKRKSLKEDFKIPNVINYNKIAKEGFLSENTEIVTNSLVKRVISAIDGKNRVKSDITPDKKTRPSNNPFTDKFVEELTRGILNENSLIKKSFAGKDIKFNNNGVITSCSVTPDKIGYRFGDFTYNNELVQKINKKIDQKLHAKEKTSTLKKNKKRIKFPHDLLVDIKDYKKVFKKGV
jgi:ribosomal protein S19